MFESLRRTEAHRMVGSDYGDVILIGGSVDVTREVEIVMSLMLKGVLA